MKGYLVEKLQIELQNKTDEYLDKLSQLTFEVTQYLDQKESTKNCVQRFLRLSECLDLKLDLGNKELEIENFIELDNLSSILMAIKQERTKNNGREDNPTKTFYDVKKSLIEHESQKFDPKKIALGIKKAKIEFIKRDKVYAAYLAKMGKLVDIQISSRSNTYSELNRDTFLTTSIPNFESFYPRIKDDLIITEMLNSPNPESRFQVISKRIFDLLHDHLEDKNYHVSDQIGGKIYVNLCFRYLSDYPFLRPQVQ